MIKKVILAITFLVVAMIASIKGVTDGAIPMKVAILTNTSIYPLSGYTYKTEESLCFIVNGKIYFVPERFETDLASIPRWYWSIISPARSDLIESAIIHDYLYQCHTKFTRKQSDDILYSSLLHEGVSEYVAGKMYFAVRLFGASHFKDLDCENMYGYEKARVTVKGA